MAKSKKSGKKPKTTKPTEKDEKLSEKNIRSEKIKTDNKTEKKEATKKNSETEIIASDKKSENSFVKKFFAKKYPENESILTIYKDRRIYGAILGEIFGTAIISIVIFTLGLTQPLYMFFVLLATIIAVYKLSGANLNPINTVGMMVTRRMSVIRGVLYLLAQVVGAWLGFLVISLFVNSSAKLSGVEAEMPGMSSIEDGYYWIVTMLEFFGATLLGFFYARAQQFRKNSVAFASVVAGGMTVAIVALYLLSYSYFGLTNNFMMNPAVALMYQILPTNADGVGDLLIELSKALFTYVIFPMVGGVVGFAISDTASILAEEK